jgi:hypothetical protein
MAMVGGENEQDRRIGWCIVKLETDLNWWVSETDYLPDRSDDELLSILDPKQVEYIFDLLEPLRGFGLQNDIVMRAFLRFAIDGDLGDGHVRLVATEEEIGESDEKLFALPNLFSESGSGYAEFLDHISLLRIKYLNSSHSFTQQLTVSELEDEVREGYEPAGALPLHAFQEIANILEYSPAGFVVPEDDGDGEESRAEITDGSENDEWPPQI